MILYRAFATVGGLTLVSRLLGFIRDILIAAALGTGAVADAFFVAFRFPNLFRRLFGEGAFNAAFVPIYARKLEGDGQVAADHFASIALSWLAIVLAVLSAVIILAMPWLMVVLAPGFVTDPDKYDLSVALTQIAFPYLLCMSLVALLSGVLNSHHRYWAAAAAPILLNVILISAILTAIHLGYGGEPGAGYLLAAGVFVAGFAQLAMLWLAVRRAALRVGFALPRWDDDMRQLVRLGIPGLIAGGITQINIVVGTIIASLQAGAVSALYFADRLYQLPLGIVGIAIGVVLLPELARKLRAGEQAEVIATQNRSLEFALALTLPAAVGLALAADPIVSVLLERGAFTAADTLATGWALVAFSLGLPAFVMIKVFQPAFFAREDTATPMRFAAVNLVINVIGSLALFFSFQAAGLMPHVGIALATSIAGWVNALMLWGALVRRGQFDSDPRLWRSLALIAVACVVMAVCLIYGSALLEPWLAHGADFWRRGLALAALIGSGLLVYLAIVFAGGVVSLSQLRAPRAHPEA